MSGCTKVLRWGFFGAGKCTHDFVSAIKVSNSHKPIGIASRDITNAKTFADKLSLPKYYGSYVDLAKDSEIDIIYIGTVNSEHFGQAKLALENGKHVLCEKPICISAKEIKELVQVAREKRLFLMEGFWTNCFPCTKKLREELDKKSIGEIVHMTIEIGNKFSHMDRFRRLELGGGITLNHGVYGIMFACMLLGKPDEVWAKGFLEEGSGVDNNGVITLSYKKKSQMATIILSSKARMPGELRLIGTEGTILMPYPFWAPQKLVTPQGYFEFPQPKNPEGVKFNYPNAAGFIYEADEVLRCISQGLLESPLVPLELSIQTLEISDAVRCQIGVQI